MWRSVARFSVSRQLVRNLCSVRNPGSDFLLGEPSHGIPLGTSHYVLFGSVDRVGSCFLRRSFSQVSMSANELDSGDIREFEENNSDQMDDKVLSISEELLDEIDGVEDVEALTDEPSAGGENSDQVSEVDPKQLEDVLSLLQSSADSSLESELSKMDLVLHEDFVVRVLETPNLVGENVIGFFKWASTNSGFTITTRVVEALVGSICAGLRKRDAYALWDLIKEIGVKNVGVLNVVVLNNLIALLSKLGKGKAALEVFDKFEEFGCVPDEMSYYHTIEALCRRSLYNLVGPVCERMLDAGCIPDAEQIGKMISWLCMGKKAEVAHSLYLVAKEKKMTLPSHSMNFLVASLSREDKTVKLAAAMLYDFPKEVRKHAIKPFSSVIRGLCRSKDIAGAKELLHKMIARGPPPGNAVFNSVISGYSKAGELGTAMELKELMEARGLKPDVYTYTVIMSGYTNGGDMDRACKVFSEAKTKHKKLNPVTYHTLIRGYCKIEEFNKALQLLSEMKESGVQPNTDEYTKLIQSLCLRAVDWETAETLLDQMKTEGLYLNGITRGLIRAVKELECDVTGSGEVKAEEA
ncbi:hypothetical protein MLD38_001565 [Melastoma candidum]|uniref:Uncharacterized protein n=1 Tax=Melastoma candidum TaxID=119954 RepID=A0ACB9SHL6_9MYRT|nr:hypothetical protein MLD38_001565 [Melastoma candidum]